MPDHALAHVVESQVAVFVGRPLDYGTDQAHPAYSDVILMALANIHGAALAAGIAAAGALAAVVP